MTRQRRSHRPFEEMAVLPNKGMHLTRSAPATRTAALAGDPQCSTDCRDIGADGLDKGCGVECRWGWMPCDLR